MWCFAVRTCAHAQRVHVHDPDVRIIPTADRLIVCALRTHIRRACDVYMRFPELRKIRILFAVKISVPQEVTVDKLLGGVLICWSGIKIEGGR